MARLDIFILFPGPGLENYERILDIIDETMPIQGVYRLDSKDLAPIGVDAMKYFVAGVYACDTYPAEHLKGKLAYLLRSPNTEFMAVVVRNPNPNEQVVGEGPYQHLQCTQVMKLKNRIRDTFNPRYEDGRRTEEHCIHGTDYEKQTEYLLDWLGLSSINYFNRMAHSELGVPGYVGVLDQFEIQEVNIDDIRINLADGYDVRIEDSPHYRFLEGNTEPYARYCRRWVGIKDFSYRSPVMFEKLNQSFALKSFSSIVVRRQGDTFFCVDGNHRLCILKHRGYKKIKVIVINPEPSNRLDFSWFFQNLPQHTIVIRKRGEFPAYQVGSDLDLLTSDRETLTAHILQFGALSQVQRIEIGESGKHRHVDFYFDDQLEYRFDLLIELSEYGISPVGTQEILGAHTVEGMDTLRVFVPRLSDDLMLRYAEYKLRPHKVKHLLYIRDKLVPGFFESVRKYLGEDLDTHGFNRIMKKEGLI